MGILQGCIPRQEVLEGDLSDAIFAADFGDLIAGKSPDVYGEASTFFRNTHPAAALKKIVGSVFHTLATADGPGATIRLSTGFGGGKTHTLMTLWHLAENVGNTSLGTELLPAAGRPKKVTVAAIDASKAGVPQFGTRDGVEVRSLWGDLFFKLRGKEGLKLLGKADDPEASPSDDQLDKAFPDGPVLILLDELVIYMAKLSERGQGNLLGFINMLLRAVSKRPQTAFVITDPGGQVSYATQAGQLAQLIAAATKLNDVLSRTVSDSDPIGDEGARVIVRRLFEKVDTGAAQKASALYHELYKRVSKQFPTLIPTEATSADYASKIVEWYPFHPRLIKTAQGRLDELKDFQRSRGVLRLFARILRDVWESKPDVDLITAGDIDWSSSRIIADLISRLQREKLQSAITSDVLGHAVELDGGARGIHYRAAAAVMYESIPLTPSSGLDVDDLTLATLRPDEAGAEPSEALDRLVGVCWHTYPMPGGKGYQFRIEPNVIKQIEERTDKIDIEDARQRVLSEVQGYYGGAVFKLAPWPQLARHVSESADLQLALCSDRKTAELVCRFHDDTDPKAPMPRGFLNAIVAISPSQGAFDQAVNRARRLLAAQAIQKESGAGDQGKMIREQLQKHLPELEKQFRLQSARAFDQVVTAAGYLGPIDEKFKFSDEEVLKKPQGQASLRRFLEEKQLIYSASDAVDVDRFMKDILPGAVPVGGTADVYTAKAIHERFLGAPGLRLLPDGSVVRNTLLKAVSSGRLVLCLDDGTAFDSKGSVGGMSGARRRLAGDTPSRLPLNDNIQLALPTSAAAVEWLREDKAKEPGPGPGGPGPGPGPVPPPPPEKNSAANWPDIVEMAEQRSLVELRLTARGPASASSLSALIQPLGADSILLSVTSGGTLKDGGSINFAISGVKPTHPTKPLAIAQTVHNALGGSGSFEAEMKLLFAGGRAGLSDQLKTVGDGCSEDITPFAVFAKKGGGNV